MHLPPLPRFPASPFAADLLPRLAERLDLSLDELLMGEPTIRIPGKRGPASRLEQQLDAITRLPKAKQCPPSAFVRQIELIGASQGFD